MSQKGWYMLLYEIFLVPKGSSYMWFKLWCQYLSVLKKVFRFEFWKCSLFYVFTFECFKIKLLILLCICVFFITHSKRWCDPNSEISSSVCFTFTCEVCCAQHDSGAPYRPATLTLPFSTFWSAKRVSLFNPMLVTSTQVHASISNSLPNNQWLWWSLIPTAYVVFS